MSDIRWRVPRVPFETVKGTAVAKAKTFRANFWAGAPPRTEIKMCCCEKEGCCGCCLEPEVVDAGAAVGDAL